MINKSSYVNCLTLLNTIGQKDLVSANVSPMRMGDELCLDEVQDATVLRGEVHIVHVSYRPTSDVPFCITVEGSGNFI